MGTDSFRHGKRPVSLRLEEYEDQEWHPYFCPDCARIMFKYKGQVVGEIPGRMPVKIGFEIKCDNRECGRIAIVEGFSKRLPEYKQDYK